MNKQQKENFNEKSNKSLVPTLSSDEDEYEEDDTDFDPNNFDPTQPFQFSIVEGSNGKKIAVQKRIKKKVIKKPTSSEDDYSEFKSEVIPFSANLNSIIEQLENDTTTLADLHKKFSDHLYRLTIEEDLLMNQVNKQNNNNNNNNTGNIN